MILRCKEKLIENATQDILILTKNSKIEEEDARFIFNVYEKAHNQHFMDKLKSSIEKDDDIENNLC
jgi:hypothetical protein